MVRLDLDWRIHTNIHGCIATIIAVQYIGLLHSPPKTTLQRPLRTQQCQAEVDSCTTELGRCLLLATALIHSHAAVKCQKVRKHSKTTMLQNLQRCTLGAVWFDTPACSLILAPIPGFRYTLWALLCHLRGMLRWIQFHSDTKCRHVPETATLAPGDGSMPDRVAPNSRMLSGCSKIKPATGGPKGGTIELLPVLRG